MILIVPEDVDGLPHVEETIVNLDIIEELSNLYTATVNVFVPKFKVEKTMDLNDILQSVSLSIYILFLYWTSIYLTLH